MPDWKLFFLTSKPDFVHLFVGPHPSVQGIYLALCSVITPGRFGEGADIHNAEDQTRVNTMHACTLPTIITPVPPFCFITKSSVR